MSSSTPETADAWRERMLRETEGLKTPGEVLAHLAADYEKNGPPPRPRLFRPVGFAE